MDSEQEFLDALRGDDVQLRAFQQFDRLGRQEYIDLWSTIGKPGGNPWVSTYSCLVEPAAVARLLESPGWDVRIDSLRPGFSMSWDAGKEIVRYEPIGAEGVEPIVHIRLATERFPEQYLFSPELLLLFDLHGDGDGRWFLFDEAGEEQLAIESGQRRVQIKTSLLRQYQAVRQMALELVGDSDSWNPELEKLGEVRHELHTDDAVFAYFRAPVDRGWISRLLGKRIVLPPAIEDCGLWPYEASAHFETFTIGTDDLGRPIEYSSDPDGLANYFGKNPDAPHYVTPVAFRREVLEKYFRAPDKYSVEDGYLRRNGFWGMRIDNDRSDCVVAMLGDLGRDLPYSEQKYWRSFNLAQAADFSETARRRGFLAEFADAASLELQFQRLYPSVN